MKFNIRRRYSLQDLGKDWKDCYVEFTPVTIREVQDITALSKVDTDDPKSVSGATDNVIALLKEHFVEGKAVNDKGELVDLKSEDLIDLPVDVLGGLVSFLLGASATKDVTPSTT